MDLAAEHRAEREHLLATSCEGTLDVGQQLTSRYAQDLANPQQDVDRGDINI
jgi:hypothetical protein